jgi:hypothetical protein
VDVSKVYPTPNQDDGFLLCTAISGTTVIYYTLGQSPMKTSIFTLFTLRLNGLYDRAELLSANGFGTTEVDAIIEEVNELYRINIYTVRKLESFVIFFNPTHVRKPLYENEDL